MISHYESGKIQRIYDKEFCSMNEKLIETVKNQCVGYTFMDTQTLQGLINKSKSINELLHTMHSYIVNNKEIMQSMPILAKKENAIKEPIVLYGEQTKISKKIFDEFPLELDCGATDIISMDEKILMMIRDRGHAMTMDIDITQDKSFVKYFIPKLCNLSMIQKLQGINKITKAGATGRFETTEEELPQNLFNFIEMVPTDFDAVWENDEKRMNHLPNITHKQDYIFEEEDAKEISMETGKNGRRITKIKQLQQKIKEAIENSKEIGENNDGETRDE